VKGGGGGERGKMSQREVIGRGNELKAIIGNSQQEGVAKKKKSFK